MNPLGLNLWNYVTHIDDNSLGLPARVKELGFTAIELPMTSPTFTPAFAAEVVDTGLDVSLCAAMFQGRDLSHFDPQVRANTMDYLTQCLQSASQVSASVLAGPLYAGGGKAHFLSADDTQREWDLAVTGLQTLAQRAKDYNVTLAIEPINRYRTSVVNTVSQALQMVADIGCDNVGVHFDTYQAGIEEVSILNAMEQVLKANKMFHFHACANNRLAPSQGFFPWDAIFSTLQRYGYDRHITMETFIHGGLDSGYVRHNYTPDQLATIGLTYMQSALQSPPQNT